LLNCGNLTNTFHVGSQLELSEDTVQGVLAACREEIGCVLSMS
jgi:hypothetical protein